MPNRIPPHKNICYTALAGAIIVACGGCGDRDDEVRSYRVPKETIPTPSMVMSEMPQSVAVASGPMTWELPDGWRTMPNPNQMRFATLAAGADDQEIEASITRLGVAGGDIEANINRWRGQLGLPNASAADIDRDTQTVHARGTTGIWVDLIGPAPDGNDDDAPRMFAAIFPTPTAAWFIKIMGSSAALGTHRDDFLALCESVAFAADTPPPATTPPPASPAAPAGSGGSGGSVPTWGALPPGWTVDDTPQAMSVASITVSGGGSLTITPLGGSQDLLANINRWRRQVGLGPVAALDEAPPVQVDIAGSPGQLIEIAGPERHVLGAVSVRGGTTWFYKLMGPGDSIGGQRDAFAEFIRSITFEGGDR